MKVRVESLYHHGILGQKWGKRNGPPYPLGASDHSRSEQKAGWRKSLGKSGDRNNTQKRSDNKNFVKKRINSFNDSWDSEDFVDDKQTSKEKAHSDAKSFIESRFDHKIEIDEDYVKLGVALLVGAGVLYIGKTYAGKKAREFLAKEFEEVYENRAIQSLTDVKRLAEPMSPSESMKLVNPDFPSPGSTQNCTFCTTAMALREKGYDVTANYSMHGWVSEDLFKKCFNATEYKLDKAKKGRDIISELSKHGDGAYGNISVYWKMGGGHSIFWKNENGVTNFYDGQMGTKYDVDDPNRNKLMKAIKIAQTQYCRLDNCEPTDYAAAIIKERRKEKSVFDEMNDMFKQMGLSPIKWRF